MKKFTLLLILLAVFQNIKAQTNVSGFISANTTWNLGGSPYIVVGNVLVSHGFTLTIEPGVVVKFNTDKALQIDGELIAIGTPQNKITFTSNQISPSAGDWAKIHFPDTCVDAVFDIGGNYLSGSIMKYCDVIYGGGLGFGEIHIDRSAPYFNHCQIMNSSSSGIYSNLSYYGVDSSSIKNCSEWGLYSDYYELIQKNIFIRNDSIKNNSSGGIYLGQCGGTTPFSIKITSCYFTGNQSSGAISTSNFTHRNVIIEENVFFSNSGFSVISAIGLENMSISCNRFISNTSRAIYLNNYPCSGNISHNVFDGNSSSGTGNIIEIENTTISTGATFFSNNVVRNNTSNSNCLKIRPQLSSNQFTQIHNNEFTNNTASNTISIDPSQSPSGNFNFLNMKHNVFINPLTQYELYNNIPYGSSNVYVDSNYWGSTNTQHIDSVIYDYFDFANQSVVYYSPILNAPIVADTTCSLNPTGLVSIQALDFKPNLYPNPATSQVTIDFNKIIKNGMLEIYNLLGGNILQENIYDTSKKEINLQTISNGIYFVKLTDGENHYCKKIIVEHD